MSNISFSDKKYGKKKAVSIETTTVPISSELHKEELTGIISKCIEVISLTDNLYKLKSDKNLSDALVTLNLTKDSLELININ